jgi:hypothetical protein
LVTTGGANLQQLAGMLRRELERWERLAGIWV